VNKVTDVYIKDVRSKYRIYTRYNTWVVIRLLKNIRVLFSAMRYTDCFIFPPFFSHIKNRKLHTEYTVYVKVAANRNRANIHYITGALNTAQSQIISYTDDVYRVF
jgi:hypothetical protein